MKAKRLWVASLFMSLAIQRAFNMPAVHFFKIKKGKVYDIEATGLVLPYGTKSGWE